MGHMSASLNKPTAIFRFLCALLLVACVCYPAPAPAQGIKSLLESLGGAPKKTAPELSPSEQLDWAKNELEKAKSEEKGEPAIQARLAEAGLPAARIEDFRMAIREMERSYQASADLLTALIAAESEPAKVPHPNPPGSEKEASVLRDALHRSSLTEKSAISELELIRRLISQYQALQVNAEREVRQLREEADTAKGPESKARAQVQWELANLQKRAAESTVFLGKWKASQLELLARKSSLDQDALQGALLAGGFDRQLDSRRADSQLAALKAESEAAEKEIAGAVKEQNRILDEVAGFREKNDSPAAQARATAADALATASQGLVSILQAGAYFLDDEKNHWSGVKSLSTDQSPGALREAIAKSGEIISKHKELRPTLDRRLLDVRDNLEALQKQLRSGVSDATSRSFIERTAGVEQKRVAALGSLISKSDQIVTTQEELLAELRDQLGPERAVQKFSRAWEDFCRTVANVWSFELFGVSDNRITTGKVIMAALGLGLALLASGWLARWSSRMATRRFQMAEDQKTLLEKSVFIPVAASLVLTVLYWLNIPLTVFAFFGGALAIGIGFGAQNLMNNFISGIILLLERQIKIGDIIEVAGSTGKVTHLGSRCSRIRKFDGVELLVPNSAFLEKEVTNWTLADPHHRFDFPIGVAYGSPVEKVMGLLQSAIERQPEILREPAPGVFFEAFGDSALTFRIYYWLELGGTLDARLVGSELRCRIERDFRAAAIEMPFPQRDLHLRSSAPISVRIEGK